MKNLILIKGAGDLATGVALRLHRAGYTVVMTEILKPSAVRRTVSFAEAVYAQSTVVESVKAIKTNLDEYQKILQKKNIPILIGITQKQIEEIKPKVIIDAILAKKNTGTYKGHAPYTIGLGPGFSAPEDVDVVIETMRGHYLGRCIYHGTALPNTGIPGEVGGYTKKRVLRSKQDGVVVFSKQIGDYVDKNDVLGLILDKKNNSKPILAPISGIIRGLLHNNLEVTKGYKIGDIDPRCSKEQCYTVSDKALAIGGAVLESLLHKKILPSA